MKTQLGARETDRLLGLLPRIYRINEVHVEVTNPQVPELE